VFAIVASKEKETEETEESDETEERLLFIGLLGILLDFQ